MSFSGPTRLRPTSTPSRRRGGTVDWINLPEIGIKGNSHMLMQDMNSAEIADVIQKWLVAKGLVDRFLRCGS